MGKRGIPCPPQRPLRPHIPPHTPGRHGLLLVPDHSSGRRRNATHGEINRSRTGSTGPARGRRGQPYIGSAAGHRGAHSQSACRTHHRKAQAEHQARGSGRRRRAPPVDPSGEALGRRLARAPPGRRRDPPAPGAGQMVYAPYILTAHDSSFSARNISGSSNSRSRNARCGLSWRGFAHRIAALGSERSAR